jgi:hypothetical protein
MLGGPETRGYREEKNLKSTIFSDITPCSPLKFNQFVTCFHPGILLGLFDLENGDNMFLRNVGWLPTDYAALYHRCENLKSHKRKISSYFPAAVS